MCTVSYIPIQNTGFILTSNRDEKFFRPTSPPAAEMIGKTKVVYPKDQNAGGTWIATGDNGVTTCLLNGAFENHIKKDSYGKSRGKVLLEVFEHDGSDFFFNECDLRNVEPFTLIVFEPGKPLFEFRWDSSKKHLKELETARPYIWSSATLYSHEIRKQRQNYFEKWYKKKSGINRKDIYSFHAKSWLDDRENDFVMQRPNGLQTVSITQIELFPGSFQMHYHDFLSRKTAVVKEKINIKTYE